MSTSFSQRAEARITTYGRHHKAGATMRQTVVPEDLRDLPEFVELEAERQALLEGDRRIQQEHRAWGEQWQTIQNNAHSTMRSTVRAAELAIENGEPLPVLPVPVFLRPRSAGVWPLAELLLSDYWQRLHRALDAHERALVIEHGREPLR